MKNKQALFLLLPILFLSLFFGWVPRFGQVQAASVKNVTVLLNNSRFSFQTALQGLQTVGSSLITLKTTGYPSISVLQAQSGDTLRIGSNDYIVATTIDDTQDNKLSLTTGMLAADVTDDTPVYSTQKSNMTVKLTTASALPNGKIRILVPAKDGTGDSRDGVPDNSGFDYGNTAQATLACPSGSPSGFDSWSATSTAANGSVLLGGVNYHSFTCAYTGTGAVNTVFDGGANGAFIISNLINPSPRTLDVGNERLGVADTYTVIVQHLTSDEIVIDQTVTKIAVIDAVRVTATILPQLTFEIIGVPGGESKCGITTKYATTPLAVPFGEITVGVFSDLAQVLRVTTNAENGYQVTAIQNDQLGRDGRACPTPSADLGCIVDANVSGMSPSVAANWINEDQYGFAYTLGDATSGLTRAFYYNQNGTYDARHFADLAASQSPQLIFSRGTGAQNDLVDVCYRLTPSALNYAGDYENYIVYTATASF